MANTQAIQVSADVERLAIGLDKASRQLKVAAAGDAKLLQLAAKAADLQSQVWELSAAIKRIA